MIAPPTSHRTSPIETLICPDESVLAEAVAARLITRIVDAQSAHGVASIVLTGGGVGIATLRAVAASPARDAVDWSRVDVYWGDERFVPADDDERNEKQAREALLDRLPFDPKRIHPMAASDGPDGGDLEAAAARYADLLAAAAPDGAAVPRFDVLMLGMGPEGHTASMFPGTDAVAEEERAVVGVTECPKPPPTRISMTRKAIASADEVWLIAAGDSKADAVSRIIRGAGPIELPAASAVGRHRSLWLLDQAAAGKLGRV
ncbi:MAG TPA: 6-phosphogluconolactonase [Frankiaceae bacterium]|nr:6-phosphogluconolactonase [Frankiaceae bacterium]